MMLFDKVAIQLQIIKQIYMHHSAQDRLFQKRQRALSKEDLVGLSPQQRQFAEEQFRLIYAQQMSRITAEMSHKKKIVDNLNTLDQLQSKNLKDQYEKLKYKMASIEQKRNKKLQQKVKSYKQNDQRWFNKLKQIQKKFKQQNRQAIEKAKKYRQQSENYWKSKERKAHDVSRTNFQNSRTIKQEAQSLHRSFVIDKNQENNKFGGLGKRATLANQHNSHRQNNMSKTDLDLQIKLHKQKSDTLQKQKQLQTFQKAMQKMQKINIKRAKAVKQSKPSQPTRPKKVDNSHQSMGRNRNRHEVSSLLNTQKQARSRDSLEKLIKDHLEIKQRLEQEQFNQRGELLENSIQKTRKERILKMIKSKVHDIKVNTMMKQGSKISLMS